MKRRIGILVIVLLALLMVWGGLSWSLGKASKQSFDEYLLRLSGQDYQHFFDVEITDRRDTFTGAEADLTLNFSVPVLREAFGELPLRAKRLNGPVFINEQGVQLGSARWELSVDESQDEVLSTTLASTFKGKLPVAVVRLDFFNTAHIRFQADSVRTRHYDANQLDAGGQFDFDNGAYQFGLTAKEMLLKSSLASLKMPDADILLQRLAPNSQLDAQANAAVFDMTAPGSQLYYDKNHKNRLLDIGSRGSLWLNNDTFNGDWQLYLDTAPSGASTALTSSVQFREWLADGLLSYWRQQAKIVNLNEQAQWALEERAETPEEQDFIMSLYADIEHIRRQLQQNALKPLLASDRSEVIVNTQLKRNGDVFGQLLLTGKASESLQQPVLRAEGELSIQQSLLNTHTTAQLDRLSRRFWLRNYETAYETDLAVRNQQLLLNNIRVSWNDFWTELKQLLNDQ